MIDYRAELENRGLDPYESGSDYIMMVCPLHDDNRPSFSVSLRTGSFRCFGCEERGTFADLIAELDGITVDEAIAKFRSETSVDDHISVLENSLDDEQSHSVVFSEKSFHNTFPPIWKSPGEWYVRARHGSKRGGFDSPRSLTRSIIERFDVRWGSETSKKYHDRVVLPIRKPSGKITSYMGRTVIADDPRPKTRKATTPEHTLFGIHELLETYDISDIKYVVLVEGEFDAMYLQQYGIPAISNMGTSPLTKYQLRIVRGLKATAVVSYDGDKAGRTAMFGNERKRIGELHVLSRHMPAIAVDLPDGMDPNKLDPYHVNKFYGRFAIKGVK